MVWPLLTIFDAGGFGDDAAVDSGARGGRAVGTSGQVLSRTCAGVCCWAGVTGRACNVAGNAADIVRGAEDNAVGACCTSCGCPSKTADPPGASWAGGWITAIATPRTLTPPMTMPPTVAAQTTTRFRENGPTRPIQPAGRRAGCIANVPSPTPRP